MNIFLTGMMGSGKSSVGQLLSAYLNSTFYDLDRGIEKRFNLSIKDIFQTYGESKFREVESELLIQTKKIENNIIATGGGLPTIEKNVIIMKNHGEIIWLDASIDLIFKRLFNSKEIRPLIGSNVKKENILNLYNSRLNVYNIADIKIDTNGKDIDQIIKEIKKNYG